MGMSNAGGEEGGWCWWYIKCCDSSSSSMGENGVCRGREGRSGGWMKEMEKRGSCNDDDDVE